MNYDKNLEFSAVGPRPDGMWIQNGVGTVAIVKVTWPQPYLKLDDKAVAEIIVNALNEHVKKEKAKRGA